MLKGIEIMLYVDDVEGAAAFWQEGLDGKIASQQTMPDDSLQVTVELFEAVQRFYLIAALLKRCHRR
jgi:lactoylglutathione lyase